MNSTLSKIFLVGHLIEAPSHTLQGRQPAWTILRINPHQIVCTDPRAEAIQEPFEVHLWGKHARVARRLVEGDDVLLEGWLELPTWGEVPFGVATVAAERITLATQDQRYVYTAA